MCITRISAFVPGPVMHSELRGELGKYCTKEKVPGELLTNAEQRASRGGGGDGGSNREREREERLTHTHTHRRTDQRGSAACQHCLLNLPSASNIT